MHNSILVIILLKSFWINQVLSYFILPEQTAGWSGMADSKQASLVEPPGYSGSSPPSNSLWLSGCLLECGVGPHGTSAGTGRSVT